MADDPRRFDDLVQTIGAMRRQLDALQATTLNRISTHSHFVMGTVDPAYSTGKPMVTVDGTSALTAAGLDRLSSYTPAASDRVLMVQTSGGYVVLGEVI